MSTPPAPSSPEWLQYLPHGNCYEVARFLNIRHPRLCCEEESTNDLPFTVDHITVQPGQWLRKFNGVTTVHNERENA